MSLLDQDNLEVYSQPYYFQSFGEDNLCKHEDEINDLKMSLNSNFVPLASVTGCNHQDIVTLVLWVIVITMGITLMCLYLSKKMAGTGKQGTTRVKRKKKMEFRIPRPAGED